MMEQGVCAAMSDGAKRCSVFPFFVSGFTGLELVEASGEECLGANVNALCRPTAVRAFFLGEGVLEDRACSAVSTEPSLQSRTSRRSSCEFSGWREDKMASLTSVDSSPFSRCDVACGGLLCGLSRDEDGLLRSRETKAFIMLRLGRNLHCVGLC